ncbi:MAG: endonuclease/exonuclease/phosphatase family protein [Spirochaetota bacterium]
MVAWRHLLLIFLLFSACAYNQRVEAPDAQSAPSTPYVPPSPPAPDTTPPGNVRSLLVTPGNGSLQISWEAPTDSDYKGTRIYRGDSSAAVQNAGTRTLVCENCSAPLTQNGLTNATNYYYLLIAYDQAGNAAGGAITNGTPTTVAPTCADSASDNCLQIATFNLEYFTSGFDGTNSATAQQAKRDGAASVILNNGFDLVALQEVKDVGVFTAWVTSGLGDDWTYLLASSGCSARLAYVYRRSLLSLLGSEELAAAPFNTTNWDGCLRRPLAATFKAKHSDKQFRLINLHLKSGSDAISCSTRQPQAGDINSYFNSTNSTPTLILGDLNDEVRAGVGICTSIDSLNALESNSALKILTQSPTMDATRYTNIPYNSTIDHLVVNAAFEAWLTPARGTYLADIVAHGNLAISDHQPALLWLKVR